MWETLHKNVNWDYFKTLILQEILKIQSPRQVEHCIWKSHICPNKLDVQKSDFVCHSALPKLKLILSMQDCEWTDFPRLIFGTW